MKALEHRRFLPGLHRPFRGSDLFARIGGQAAVDRLVDALYDGLAADPGLEPLFDRDLTVERQRQKVFFAEWLGGPAGYSDRAWAGLAHRHGELPLTRALAGHWLKSFRRALEVVPEADRPVIFQAAQELALALAGVARPPDGRVAHGMCVPRDQPSSVARELARRGDAGGLRELYQRSPTLLDRPLDGAELLGVATVAGRLEVVSWLLERGVDPDRPANLAVDATGWAFERVIFLTPMCAARWRRRKAIVVVLAERKARDDVFTAAFLGDLPSLRGMLAGEPALAHAPDPALDVVEITPLHHAICGAQEGAAELLLELAPRPPPGADRALRGAAALGSLGLVERLLALGANPARVGTGRWVLDPRLAPVLARAGATVDESWIGASCTGNQGRKDDPDYVRALLAHGARAGDRRPGSGATALHHAARAGFLGTIEVLLEHGADPGARDAAGQTPRDWLERATRSVDRSAVARLLGPDGK